MILRQAIMNDAPSPHTPSPLPADAAATVTRTDIVDLASLQLQPVERPWQHRLAASPFTICEVDLNRTAQTRPPSRSSQLPAKLHHRSTGQDGQINYLSILTIFVKQTTYLATLPNPNLKANHTAGRTVPHILSQTPVDDFVENGAKSRLPSYFQNPTLAHTGCHCISSQRMDAAMQQFMRRRQPQKTLRQGPSPRSLVANRCRHPPTRMTYHAYHAYHAPFPSAGNYGFRGHGEQQADGEGRIFM